MTASFGETARVNPEPKFAGYGFDPFMDALRTIEIGITRRRNQSANGRYDVLRIGGIDPGTLTGLTQLYCSKKTGKILAWATTILANDELQQAADLHAWVRAQIEASSSRAPFRLAVEDFKVNKVNGDEEFLSPVRIGRRLEGMLMATEPQFAIGGGLDWYMPARKAEFSDTRLEALGLYVPGPDHRRDATRHALIARKYVLNDRGL